jgi:hypothetical protein
VIDLALGGRAQRRQRRAASINWRAGLHRDRAGSWVRRHCKGDAEGRSAVVALLVSHSGEVCTACQTATG